MKIPLRISTRKLILSEPAIASIKSKAHKLEQISDQIISCRIMVERPHRSKHQGLLFNVSIDLSLPGAKLAVKRETNVDITVAIRDAFDAARRQLLSYCHKRNDKSTRTLAENIFAMERRELEIDEFDLYDEFSLSDNSAYELDYS